MRVRIKVAWAAGLRHLLQRVADTPFRESCKQVAVEVKSFASLIGRHTSPKFCDEQRARV